jgi:dihydropteroate synthase
VRSPAPPRGFVDSERVYLRPVGLLRGGAAARALDGGQARRLAGGAVAFSAFEIATRSPEGATIAWLAVSDLDPWRDSLDAASRARVVPIIERLTAPRVPLAGIALDSPKLMGVVNVTPDSFSDGGALETADHAIAHGRSMAAAGAAIIDVGGESTRPGAESITPAEEQDRVLAVVRGLVASGHTVSIDTRNPTTMTAAADAGATLINDVTALAHAIESERCASASGLAIILMHSAGNPTVMQDDPVYDHAALDVFDRLEARIAACEAVGLMRDRIAVDPGIGFGKTVAHNLRLIAWTSLLHGLGCAVAIGVSRKSTIGQVAGGMAEDPRHRVTGSLALAQAAWDQGAQILRVHDVAETAQALSLWKALG